MLYENYFIFKEESELQVDLFLQTKIFMALESTEKKIHMEWKKLVNVLKNYRHFKGLILPTIDTLYNLT